MLAIMCKIYRNYLSPRRMASFSRANLNLSWTLFSARRITAVWLSKSHRSTQAFRKVLPLAEPGFSFSSPCPRKAFKSQPKILNSPSPSCQLSGDKKRADPKVALTTLGFLSFLEHSPDMPQCFVDPSCARCTVVRYLTAPATGRWSLKVCAPLKSARLCDLCRLTDAAETPSYELKSQAQLFLAASLAAGGTFRLPCWKRKGSG